MDDDLYLRFLELNSDQLKRVLSRPPLASALQNFENAIFLSANGWHPQALTLLGSAIESAGRAYFNIPIDDKKTDLSSLGPSMNHEFPQDFKYVTGRRYQLTQFTKFRLKRNKVTHYGSSPKDGEEAAYLIYSFAIPLLNDFIKLSIDVSILDLLPGTIGNNLSAATRLLQTFGEHKIPAINLICGVTHAVRREIREDNLSWWESELVSDPNTWQVFDFKNARKEKLQEEDPYITISCPVCDCWEESLVVRIDDRELEKGKIVLDSARCFECDWESTIESRELLRELCHTQITKDLVTSTLDAYGIKSDGGRNLN